ncbi:hypothetical protein [Candidatus Sororendozoicomonas aggregata]|uniref:hypothetical protein n=1 Tax=Candidatus Sororendozoicomonas aggregata TaxID=3073239 RepID=UPI002ED49C90
MNSPVNYVDPWGLSASGRTIDFNSAGYKGQSNTIDPYSIGQTNFLETFFPSIHQPIQAQPWSAAEADAYYNSPEFQKQGAVGDVYVVDLLVGGAIAKGAGKAGTLAIGVLGRTANKIPNKFYKRGGGANADDFISVHAQKHMFDAGRVSTKKRTQFGENINVQALVDDTMSSDMNAVTTNGITKYKKSYDFNISTPDTPTGEMRVFINHNNPSRSSQFPYFAKKKK